MSVDSISNKRMAELAERRRQLEEEKSDELDKIEGQYHERVRETRESRAKDVAAIRDDAAKDIAETNRETSRKVIREREGANEKLRDFQEASARLTEDAEKSLRQKAEQLSRYERELRDQKDHIEKKNDESTRKLAENHEERTVEMEKQEREQSHTQYAKHRDRVKEEQERENGELAYLGDKFRRDKSREVEEGNRRIAAVRNEKEMGEESYRHEIEKNKETFADQNFELRKANEEGRARVQSDYDDGIAALARHNRSAVSGEQIKGQREIKRTQAYYDQQISQAQKDAKKEFTDKQMHAQMRLAGIESEAQQQEHLASQAYYMKRDKFEQESQKDLAYKDSRNNALREKYRQEYELNGKTMLEKSRTLHANQEHELTTDLTRAHDNAKVKINAAVAAGTAAVDDYMNKASDPFYRLRGMDAHVADHGEEFVVRMRVPEHEKDHVHVTGKANELMVSGSRRAETRAHDEDGRKVTTNNFQTYSETVPVKGMPDFQKMSRTYEGGVLTVKIPKI